MKSKTKLIFKSSFSLILFAILFTSSLYIHEILQVSVCTGEDKSNSVREISGRLEAGCHHGAENRMLFNIIGGSVVTILAGEFFILSMQQHWKIGKAVCMFFIGYHMSIVILESNFYYVYMNVLITYLLSFCVAGGFAYISTKIPNKLDKIKNWFWIVVAIVLTSSTISSLYMYNHYIVPNSIGLTEDLPNWLTINLEITIGFIIALFLYNTEQKNRKDGEKTINEIKKMIKPLSEFHLVKRKQIIDSLKKVFEDCIEISTENYNDIEKWKIETDDMKKEIIKAKILAKHESMKRTLESAILKPTISYDDVMNPSERGLLRQTASLALPIPEFKANNQCRKHSINYAIDHFPRVVKQLEDLYNKE